jgi:hypothetical protein
MPPGPNVGEAWHHATSSDLVHVCFDSFYGVIGDNVVTLLLMLFIVIAIVIAIAIAIAIAILLLFV